MANQYDGLPGPNRSHRPAFTPVGSAANHDPDHRSSAQHASRIGMVGLAIAAAAGVAALGVIGAQTRDTRRRTTSDPGRETEVERSITIEDVDADELYRRWRDPETMRRIMAPIADVRHMGGERTRWSAGPDLGSWDMRLVQERPHEFMLWQAEGGSALIREVSVRFRPASGRRGTVVVLRARLDPPGGMLGRVATQMLGHALPGALASTSLHYFKALVQTGEIPTTERQPAARRDPR